MCCTSDCTRACAADSSPRRSRAASSASRADFSASSNSTMRTRTACNSSCSSRSRCLRDFALGGPFDDLLRKANVLRFALLLLGGRRFELRLQLGQVRRHFRQHRLDALHGKHRAAAALFESGHVGAHFAGELCGFIATLAQRLQAALRGLHLGFQRTLLLLVLKQFAELRGDETLALAVFFADALQFALIGGKPLAHARHLAFELAQGVLGGHGLALGFALLVFQALQAGR